MAKQLVEGERMTKRVKLVHNSRINTNSASIRRRLRKIGEEFQPATFSFVVQARSLCVGMSVVYRVSLSLSTTGLSTSSGEHPTQSSWVIAMSQTKWREFYARLDAILHHPTVTQYLLPPTDIQQLQKINQEVEWKPYDAFLHVLTDIFQRYNHLQYVAFSTQADANTMHARRIELERFLLDCWGALQIVAPVLAMEPYLPDPLGQEVLYIYLLMRDLLSLPDSLLDVNRRYANAILSMEDATDLDVPTHSEHSCSICLEALVSSNHSHDNKSTFTCAPRSHDKTVIDFSVRLPCGHMYHENCAMLWLRHNPSCPECRAPVGIKSDQSSL